MKKMKTLGIQVGDNMFQCPKKTGVLQLEGVLQLGGIRYINNLKLQWELSLKAGVRLRQCPCL